MDSPPAESRECIVESGRMLLLRREPVIDRDDLIGSSLTKLGAHVVMAYRARSRQISSLYSTAAIATELT